MNLSKTKYTSFHQCPKRLWMEINKPEEAAPDLGHDTKLENGTQIGMYARKMFGEDQCAYVAGKDGTPDTAAMIERTRQLMDSGAEIITEAAFSYNGCYCAVDILRKTAEGQYSIYEVKSATHEEGDEKDALKKIQTYLPDVAYQTYILDGCGIKISGVNLVFLNSEYVLPESKVIDPKELFTVVCCDNHVTRPLMMDTASKIQNAKAVMASEDEWIAELNLNCRKPFDCPFIDYCLKKRGVEYPSVFNLYRMQWKKKIELLNSGIVTFEDAKGHVKSDVQKMQIECTLADREFVNVKNLSAFVEQLGYPMYFLDFETMQTAIPEYPGTHPYQQVPFQYSLHIKLNAFTQELTHKEFLGEPERDPRRELAERLCGDIPMDACVIAYNKTFECTRLKELAEAFPDLAGHLMNISEHIIDLADPFQHCNYYVPAMKDSFSIKSVLPALFPDNDELDYHKLDENVQNGVMAMNTFPAMKSMNESKRFETRKALLAYCSLDTLAMVRVLERIYQVIY